MRRSAPLMVPALRRGNTSPDVARPNIAGAVKAAFPRRGVGTIKYNPLVSKSVASNSQKFFERVLTNHEIISVRKDTEQAIVILDAKEYSSLVETLYLLSNPTKFTKPFAKPAKQEN
jgi:PHD/YefM family antitoxin component YafN of YafNO toxin-antitoxin module